MALYENKLLIPVIWYVILFCSSNNVDFIINIFFCPNLSVSVSVGTRELHSYSAGRTEQEGYTHPQYAGFW